jgi:hypothetical protein
MPVPNKNTPDCPHQTIHKELVLFRWGLLPRIPHFGITALHQPSLKVDGMSNVWVVINFVRGEG